jgi:chromate reductase
LTKPLDILGISGSIRPRSYNRALLRAATRLCPPEATITPIEIGGLPFYDGDVQAGGDPPGIAELKERVRAADGVLICTPEYNHAMPGVLKNAIDWLSRPLATSPLVGKPIGICGASDGPYGTVRAQQNLRLVLASTLSLVMVQPTLFIVRAPNFVDDSGEFVDQATLDHLSLFLTGLVDWAELFRKNPRRHY